MIRPRMRAALLAGFILLFGAGQALAYDPPAGGLLVSSLPSPLGLAVGGSVTALDAPWADRLNPAASAGQQRPALDAGFVAFSDFGASGQGFGGAGGLGVSVPKPYAVLGASLRLLSVPATMSAMPLGTIFETRGTIAKDLFPNLYVGAGLGLSLGSNQGAFGWGLGLDLGFVHLLGDRGFLKDLRWGGVLSGLGKGYSTALPAAGNLGTSPSSSYPSAFSLGLGVRTLLVRSADWKVGLGFDLSAPSFQDLGLNLSANLSFRDLVTLRSSWGFTARELVAGSNRSLVPAFSLAATIPVERKADDSFLSRQGWNKGELKPSLTAAPLYGGVWAVGGGMTIPLGVVDKKPPKIEVKFPSTPIPASAPQPPTAAGGAPAPFYLSPNSDGAQDLLEIPLSISDERYLVSFTMTVFKGQPKSLDPVSIEELKAEKKAEREAAAGQPEAAAATLAEGEPVRVIANKETRPETQGLEGLWARLGYVKKGVPVPDKLVWNGRSEDGSLVPDGEYSILIEAIDDNGNRA
ncbi:MAG: hypothetical protein JNG85_01910, partial [Spirochaetaceae bacterium]|nr:hypothetical protein [Spirochaetaceae bacterium]